MNLGLSLGIPTKRDPNTYVNRRIARLLDGVNQTTTLSYVAGDEIILDLYPLAGNNGLPEGCPAVVNNTTERVAFTATDSGVIGNNGVVYFSGILFRCEINGVIYPLNDSDSLIRNADGSDIATWVNAPPVVSMFQNLTSGAWTAPASSTTYPLSPLLTAIYYQGAHNIISAADTLHTEIHGGS